MSGLSSILSRAVARVILLLSLSACLPPAVPVTEAAAPPRRVRVTATGNAPASEGTLVRLTPDSVAWRPDGSGSVVRALSLTDAARVEVGERRSQRDLLVQGLRRGALVGAAIGGVVIAAQGSIGAAVAITVASAWFGGVGTAQQAEGPRPPVAWQVVHPRG